MASGLADSIFTARTLVEAGIVGPTRPDRAVRSLVGLQRWGSTLTSGYLGAAAMHPHAMAIIDEAGILTFAEVNARTSALAQALAERGVSAGDNVAIMCRNHRGFIEASVASSKLGANALYLNTAFAALQTRDVIARERPVAIVYDQEFTATIGDSVAGRPAVLAWVDDAAAARHETLEQLIASAPARMPSPPAQSGRTVILTSGTTGTPKGANATPEDLRAAPGTAGRPPRGTVVKILDDAGHEVPVGPAAGSSSGASSCSTATREARTSCVSAD